MKTIRLALARLSALREPLWRADQTSVWVDADGMLHVEGPAGPETLGGQTLVAETLNLVAPFTTSEGSLGPDLARPRPELRIEPGRLSGSPHVRETRLETCALFSLVSEGMEISTVLKLYPFVSEAQVVQSIELEAQLEANLAIRAA